MTKHREGERSGDKSNPDPRTLFFLIESASCYAFVPISRQYRTPESIQLSAVVNRDGSIVDGTEMVVGDRSGPYPGRARWAVQRVNLNQDKGLNKAALEGILGTTIAGSRFRIVPAILEGNKENASDHPSCMGIEGDSQAADARILLVNSSSASAEWEILFHRSTDEGDEFALHCVALDRYATMGGGGFLNSVASRVPGRPFPIGREALFMFKYSMGYLSINADRPFSSLSRELFAQGLTSGATIRVGGGLDAATDSSKKTALARWALIRVAPKIS
jgi:hypothetical protein